MSRRTSERQRKVRQHIENLGSEDIRLAVRSEQILSRYYVADFAEDLKNATMYSDPCVRWRAAGILAWSGIEGSYDVLVALLDDPDEVVQYQAAIDLGVVGDVRVIPRLIEIMCSENAGVSMDTASCVGLSHLGDPVLPSLIEVIRNGSIRDKENAADAIALVGTQQALECLNDLCSSDNDSIRDAVARALDLYNTTVHRRRHRTALCR